MLSVRGVCVGGRGGRERVENVSLENIANREIYRPFLLLPSSLNCNIPPPY